MNIEFPEYLGTEHQNLIGSFIKFKNEYDLFYNLDLLYKEPIRRLIADGDDSLTIQLYFFIHYHLYFSISLYFRTHLSDSLNSTRKAIDASLIVYKVLLNPSLKEDYLNRKGDFIYLKKEMQKEIKSDSKKYTLAHELLRMHEACSEYGSHADISSFAYRIKLNKKELSMNYFQYPEVKAEQIYYFILTLHIYYLIFKIYKIEYFDKTLKIIDQQWENKFIFLGEELNKKIKYLYSQIEKEQKNNKETY